MKDEWFSPSELDKLGLPGLPKGRTAIADKAREQGWRSRLNRAGQPLARRRKKGKGGGWEYHYTLLPMRAQRKLINDSKATLADEAAPKPGRSEIWDWYSRQSASKRAEAEERLSVLIDVNDLWRGGSQKNLAVSDVSKARGIGASTIYGWFKLVAGVDEADWLPHLCRRNIGRTSSAQIDPLAWDWYKGQYLARSSKPASHADTYRRLLDVARAEGWAIASARTFIRRMDQEVDAITQKASREGIEAAKSMLPTQQRDVSMFAAGEVVNGDGIKFDSLWVRFEDGEIINTATSWFYQDVKTRRYLAWRLGKTENTDIFRLATFDLTGICAPTFIFLDNTTVAANKLMTASASGRHRFHTKSEDGIGLLQMLGMEPRWTNPDKETGNSGAKPIERSYGIGGIHAMVRSNPALRDRGYSKKTAIDVAELRAVIAHEVARYNAQTGRRTQACGGVLSFDQAWEQAVAERTPRVLAESQRRLLLMAREIVRADKAGVLTLKAGSAAYGLKNRYWAEPCIRIAGKKVAVHFDPENLHAPVHVYGLDGRYLFACQPWEAAGFADTAKGREYGKFRQRQNKALKQAVAAGQRMDALERARLYADATGPAPDAPSATEAPNVVEGHFKRVPNPERDAERDADEAAGTVIHPDFQAPAASTGTDDEWFNETLQAGVALKRAGLDE